MSYSFRMMRSISTTTDTNGSPQGGVGRRIVWSLALVVFLWNNSAQLFWVHDTHDRRTLLLAAENESATMTTTHEYHPNESQAILAYRKRVEETFQVTSRRCKNSLWNFLLGTNTGSSSAPSVDIAHACLNLTSTSTNATNKNLPQLKYPDDAEEHFYEIRQAMAPWAQHDDHKMHSWSGYRGPWIENVWISYFETLIDKNHTASDDTCLSDHFGPFIPLLLPWVDLWTNNRKFHQTSGYPAGFVDALISVLRPNVPYVTVSQNDAGIPDDHDPRMAAFMSNNNNILVLSAGGYGQVPIPLFKQPEPVVESLKAPHDRKHDLSYVGSLKHAPKAMRRTVHERLLSLSSSESVVGNENDNAITGSTARENENDGNSSNSKLRYGFYYGDKWREVMADSRLSLAPRGYGRTAFHLVETLHMGLVPVHVYLTNDVPWVPYQTLFERDLGFVVAQDQFEEFAVRIATQNISVQEIERREKRILELRDSHFSFGGVMDQIQRFLLGKPSDLQCQPLPDTPTGRPPK